MRSIGRFLLLATLFVAGSASAAEGQKKKQKDVITAIEIDSSAFRDQDAFALIKGLRPHFFERPKGIRTMGNSNSSGLLLVIDNVRQTDLGMLRGMRAVDVLEARYLDPDRSQDEFGVMHNGGAVVVKTRKTNP